MLSSSLLQALRDLCNQHSVCKTLSQNVLPGEVNYYGQETDLPLQKSCRIFPAVAVVADKGDTRCRAREVLRADFQQFRKSPQKNQVGMICSPFRTCPDSGTILPQLKKRGGGALSLTSLVTGQVTYPLSASISLLVQWR